MGTRFTHNLKELDSNHVSIAGGKGASLGELIRAGVSMPQGFVVTSQAFDAFINMVDQEGRVKAIFKRLDSREMTTGQAAWPGLHRGRA